MTLPEFPVAVVFPRDVYDEKADMLKLIMNMPYPDGLGRFLVFSTRQLASDFIKSVGASALQVVRCPADRLRNILHFAKPNEIIIDPGTANQILSIEAASSWAYGEIAKSLPLRFPCSSPTDPMEGDIVPLLHVNRDDPSRDFWAIFGGQNIASAYAEQNGGGKQEFHTFKTAKDLLDKVDIDKIAERADEVWIGGLIQDGNRRMQFIWEEKMPLETFRQRVIACAEEENAEEEEQFAQLIREAEANPPTGEIIENSLGTPITAMDRENVVCPDCGTRMIYLDHTLTIRTDENLIQGEYRCPQCGQTARYGTDMSP